MNADKITDAYLKIISEDQTKHGYNKAAPGFGTQQFLAASKEKARKTMKIEAKALADKRGYTLEEFEDGDYITLFDKDHDPVITYNCF